MRFLRYLKIAIAPLAVAVIALGVSVIPADMAFASVNGTVITPSGEHLYVRSGPGTGYSEIAALSRGTVVSFSCYETGTKVTGPYGPENVWDRLDSGGFVSDAWIYTGNNNAVVPACGASAPAPSVGCHAKSCVGKNPGTEGCLADAQIVTTPQQDILIWEPGKRKAAVVWQYHSNACDAAWFVAVGGGNPDAGDAAHLSAWNPHGPSQPFTYSYTSPTKVTRGSSLMVDDENGVYACVGAHVYYSRVVITNGEPRLVETYYGWELLRCR